MRKLLFGLTRFKAPIPEKIFFEIFMICLHQERVSSIVSPRDDMCTDGDPSLGLYPLATFRLHLLALSQELTLTT